LPCFPVKMWFNRVVLPLPRKPVMTCTRGGGGVQHGSGLSQLCYWHDSIWFQQGGLATAQKAGDTLHKGW
jgi:hypothetical protein